MIYSTVEAKKKLIENDWGQSFRFEFGEYGRGRKLLVLPVFENQPDIVAGENKGISIGQTKTGRPRIVNGDDGAYAIISSEGGYTRRGDGKILASSSAAVELLGKGNGADGDAGRIGSWDVVVIKLLSPVLIKVKYGGGSTYEPRYLYFDGKQIYSAYGNDNLATMREELENLDNLWNSFEEWETI